MKVREANTISSMLVKGDEDRMSVVRRMGDDLNDKGQREGGDVVVWTVHGSPAGFDPIYSAVTRTSHTQLRQSHTALSGSCVLTEPLCGAVEPQKRLWAKREVIFDIEDVLVAHSRARRNQSRIKATFPTSQCIHGLAAVSQSCGGVPSCLCSSYA